MTGRVSRTGIVGAAVVVLLAAACTPPDAGRGRTPDTPPPAAASSTTGPAPSAPAGAPASVRFSVLGDIDSTGASDAVLRSIADRHDDFTLAVGDLSYGEGGQEDGWCRFVTGRVGPTHPFELVSGNHESDGPNGDIDRFARCLPNRLPGLVGTYGRQWYVDEPAVRPLVRVVMVSPAIDFGHGDWSYDDGTPHQRWLEDAVTGARAAGIPWVVVGMHKPCLSIGNYRCDPGPDLLNLLVRTGVDLVVTGHEHIYQRTKPVALGPGCDRVRPGPVVPACVAGSRGTTFVTVGTGGTGLRAVHDSDSERGWFVAASGANRDPSYGSLDVDVRADRLTASFVPVAGGGFTDRVVLTR